MGATDFINPKDYDKPVQDVIVELTDGGVDFSFGMYRQRQRNALSAGVLPQRLGREHHYRCGRRGSGDQNPSLPAGDRARMARVSIWRRRKGRTQLPGMVEDAMVGKIQLDPFITHRLPLEQINEAFDLDARRKIHSHRYPFRRQLIILPAVFPLAFLP